MEKELSFLDPVAKDWLVSMLKQGEVLIKFTKVDGSERTMRCTLDESLMLPLPVSVESKRTKKQNDSVLAVYDIDKESWRSFRLDSISSIEINI